MQQFYKIFVGIILVNISLSWMSFVPNIESAVTIAISKQETNNKYFLQHACVYSKKPRRQKRDAGACDDLQSVWSHFQNRNDFPISICDECLCVLSQRSLSSTLVSQCECVWVCAMCMGVFYHLLLLHDGYACSDWNHSLSGKNCHLLQRLGLMVRTKGKTIWILGCSNNFFITPH